jgi:tetratricopeptide (TPR) repeat protein
MALALSEEAHHVGVNLEYIAAEIFRHVEEAFPSMTEEAMDYVMRIISAKLQDHYLNELREEGESGDEGKTLFDTGTQFLESFERSGGLDTLQEAVNTLHRAVAQCPQGHRYRGPALNNLANALSKQYEQNGDTSILEDTVDVHRKALLLRPQGHPHRAHTLNYLAVALMMQYKQDGDMAKLAEIVDRHSEALLLRPQGHPDRAISLNNLANSLMRQYKRDGDMAKLAEIVNRHREALSLRPQGHPDRATSLNNLACSLMTQYKADSDMSKLAEMVNLHREAVSLHLQGHPDRGGSLSNLANALMTQYEHDGNMSKLAETVDQLREALFLHPQGHPDRATSLNSLANALRMQYEQDGDMSKFVEAIDCHREALSLRPQGHPSRGDSLNNLSNSYLTLYKHDSRESTLINSLRLRRECLDSWTSGHPNRYKALHHIARVQLRDSSLFNWQEALDHLMQAMLDNNIPPRLRLIEGIQSMQLVEQTSFRDTKQFFCSQQALDVYVETIQLLPRAAHVGLDISARLRELSGSEQLCRAAAMRAMLLDQLPTAVEVFEEGKAVFWSQALRLRSTALDELPTAERERLRNLFRELDAERADRSTEGLEKVDLERHIEHRRQLNEQADHLIDKIRGRSGFERFLRIPQYEQLAQAASNGIVVALIANEPNYFAIIVRAGEGPQSVSLPSVDREKLRRLIELTSGSGMRNMADRGLAKERVPPRVPLERMWRTIVQPVLLHLGLQVRRDCLILSLLTQVRNRRLKDDIGHDCIGIPQETLHCCLCTLLAFARVIIKPVLQTTWSPPTLRHSLHS